MIKSSLARKGFVWLTFPDHCITERHGVRNSSRAGTWRQELMQRPQRNTAYWLAVPGLLASHFYRAGDHLPRGNSTHNRLGPSASVIPDLMPHGLAYGLIFRKHFFFFLFCSQLTSLFLNDCSLCQVAKGKKKANHTACQRQMISTGE